MSADTLGVALVSLFGVLTFGVLVPNAMVALMAILLRLRSTPARYAAPLAAALRIPVPFVSVHVPAHDEPAHLLIATIDALVALRYPSYEVIVLDNNTPDPKVWMPVERHCALLGPRFRFIHRQGVAGAKAGALDIALDLVDPRTTHVAVVDADYIVTPDFLNHAVEALGEHGADYVQFPQAYRHGPQADPVAAELGDYFRGHAPAANATGSMLLTGTLSVISIDWLRAVGGWPTDTITEDADLGLNLYARGARGAFVNRIVGHGLLPLDFNGLVVQRHRWVAGNMQTLARGIGDLAWRQGFPGGLSVLAQLLAWPTFAAFPAMALVAAAAVRFGGAPSAIWLLVEAVAAATLLCAVLATVLEQALMKRQAETLQVKLALLWTSSLAWLPLMWGRQFVFHRTPKSGGGRGSLPAYMQWGGFMLFLAAIVLGTTGAPLAGLALLLPLLGLPAAAAVDRALITSTERMGADAMSRGDTDL